MGKGGLSRTRPSPAAALSELPDEDETSEDEAILFFSFLCVFFFFFKVSSLF